MGPFLQGLHAESLREMVQLKHLRIGGGQAMGWHRRLVPAISNSLLGISCNGSYCLLTMCPSLNESQGSTHSHRTQTWLSKCLI